MNKITPLMLELLEWISDRPRSYAETMDTWRSTCPRLTTWEDAVIRGLVQVEWDGDATHDLIVSLTALGRSALDERSRDQKKGMRASAGASGTTPRRRRQCRKSTACDRGDARRTTGADDAPRQRGY